MTLSPTMRLFLVFAAILSGGVFASQMWKAFGEDEVDRKDFIQEYVFARAVLAGQEPYLRMPDMVGRYFDPPPKVNWDHPAPHTPATAVLSVPLAAMPYRVAAFVWLLLELAILAAAWAAVLRWWGEVPWTTGVVLFLLSLSLGPVLQELFFGNLSILLLGLLLAAWLNLRAGRDVLGGASLGLAIAIKLTGWPIVLWLAWKRRWNAALAAAAVVIALHLVAVAAIGMPSIADYYSRVGPSIARGYQQHDGNFSLWTVGPRVVGGTYESVLNVFVAEPPLDLPELNRVLKPGVPIIGLLLSLLVAIRSRAFDVGFGVLVCASLFVNPVAWDHSLIVAAIPIVIALKRLSLRGWPRLETTVAIVCFVATMFPQKAYMMGATAAFATPVETRHGFVMMMPFALGGITYLPLAALIGWMWILTRVDDEIPRAFSLPKGERGGAWKF